MVYAKYKGTLTTMEKTSATQLFRDRRLVLTTVPPTLWVVNGGRFSAVLDRATLKAPELDKLGIETRCLATRHVDHKISSRECTKNRLNPTKRDGDLYLK